MSLRGPWMQASPGQSHSLIGPFLSTSATCTHPSSLLLKFSSCHHCCLPCSCLSQGPAQMPLSGPLSGPPQPFTEPRLLGTMHLAPPRSPFPALQGLAVLGGSGARTGAAGQPEPAPRSVASCWQAALHPHRRGPLALRVLCLGGEEPDFGGTGRRLSPSR